MDRGEALSIIDSYYNAHPELKTLLLKHSESVCRKALEILARPENSGLELDRHLVETGALLHDIGRVECNAPGILCQAPTGIRRGAQYRYGAIRQDLPPSYRQRADCGRYHCAEAPPALRGLSSGDAGGEADLPGG